MVQDKKQSLKKAKAEVRKALGATNAKRTKNSKKSDLPKGWWIDEFGQIHRPGSSNAR